jgi:hypothetical protein
MLLGATNALSSQAERGICSSLCVQKPVVVSNPRILRVRDLLLAEGCEGHTLRKNFNPLSSRTRAFCGRGICFSLNTANSTGFGQDPFFRRPGLQFTLSFEGPRRNASEANGL